MPGNMLIPLLCEQLIGHCTAHQAVREGEAVGLDASVWHGVHHRPYLATPSHLTASEEKIHTFVGCLSPSLHIHPRDVGKAMLAQLAGSRERDWNRDTH